MTAKRFQRSLSILGWALNEEESIVGYIDRVGQYLARHTDDYELILIDDGSTDRTYELAEQCQATRPWLRLYRNDRNRGSGYNARRAISLARKDYCFWQTVDWAYDIELLAANLPLLDRYDILQGVREDTLSFSGMFRRRSDNARKGLVSVVNYLLVRLLFRLPLSDYQNVTVYPRRLIQSVVLESESAFTNPECLLKTWWTGASFKEVPVKFLKRERGTAKGTRPKAIWAAITDILYWWTRWVVLGRREHCGTGTVAQWTMPEPALARPERRAA